MSEPAAEVSIPMTLETIGMLCYACKTPFDEGEEELRCMVSGCANCFHVACVTAVNLTADAKKDWACPQCRCSVPKGGDCSRTPVGASKIRATNITLRKKSSAQEQISTGTTEQFALPSVEFLEVMQEIRQVRLDMALMKDMVGQVTSIMVQYDLKLNALNTQLAAMCSQAKAPVVTDDLAQPTEHLSLPAQPTEHVPLPTQPAGHLPLPAQPTKHLLLPVQPKEHLLLPAQPIEHQLLPAHPTEHRPMYATVLATKLSPKKTASEDLNKQLSVEPQMRTTNRQAVRAPGGKITDDMKKSAVQVDAEENQGHSGRMQRPTSICCIGSPTAISLKAVERRRFIHLWNMVSGLEEVRAYVKELCPTGTCIVEELNPKGDYKSYKIGIPDAHYEKFFTAEAWPDNARLKAWTPFRGQRTNTTDRTPA